MILADLKRGGFHENESAQAKADEWVQRAQTQDLEYVDLEFCVDQFQKVEIGAGGICTVEAVRVSRDFGYLMAGNSEYWTFDPRPASSLRSG